MQGEAELEEVAVAEGAEALFGGIRVDADLCEADVAGAAGVDRRREGPSDLSPEDPEPALASRYGGLTGPDEGVGLLAALGCLALEAEGNSQEGHCHSHPRCTCSLLCELCAEAALGLWSADPFG
jgi:hypothetical protein